MLIFFDCGKRNCPDARGFRCFLGKGVLDRKLQEEVMFGVCVGVVERSNSAVSYCDVTNDFFLRYMSQFPRSRDEKIASQRIVASCKSAQ